MMLRKLWALLKRKKGQINVQDSYLLGEQTSPLFQNKKLWVIIATTMIMFLLIVLFLFFGRGVGQAVEGLAGPLVPVGEDINIVGPNPSQVYLPDLFTVDIYMNTPFPSRSFQFDLVLPAEVKLAAVQMAEVVPIIAPEGITLELVQTVDRRLTIRGFVGPLNVPLKGIVKVATVTLSPQVISNEIEIRVENFVALGTPNDYGQSPVIIDNANDFLRFGILDRPQQQQFVQQREIINIDGCMNIDQSHVTYRLTRSFSTDAVNCFVIDNVPQQVVDVVIDCGGKTIEKSADKIGHGIFIGNANGVTIQNCIIRNFDVGVNSIQSNSIIVKNSIFTGNNGGISVLGGSASLLQNKLFVNGRGISISDQANVFVNENVACNNVASDFLCSNTNWDNSGSLNFFNPAKTLSCVNNLPILGTGFNQCSVLDADQDGVETDVDLCPNVANPAQSDTDYDGLGNNCDNCPIVVNPNQADADGDNVGDACDPEDNFVDTDGDGRQDYMDNCPAISNPDQADADEDEIGDACACPAGVTNFLIGSVYHDCVNGVWKIRYLQPCQESPQCVTGAICDPVTKQCRSDVGGMCGYNGQLCVGGLVCDDKGLCAIAPVVAPVVVASNICGNGIVEAPEQCDDGNLINTDFCTKDCLPARCGDGFIQPGEQCDGGLLCNVQCKKDSDRDGIGDDVDNCPAANANQSDQDSDGVGDVCDNCLAISNPSQADADEDEIGDACEAVAIQGDSDNNACLTVEEYTLFKYNYLNNINNIQNEVNIEAYTLYKYNFLNNVDGVVCPE